MRDKLDIVFVQAGKKVGVLCLHTTLFSKFLLLYAQKVKIGKTVIKNSYGKMGSWISHMFYLIHSAIDSDKKKIQIK